MHERIQKMRKAIAWGLLLAGGLAVNIYAQEPENPNPAEQKAPEKPKYVPKDKIIAEEYQLSNTRIEKINALVQKYYNERKNLESPSVINDLKQEIQQIVPLVPAKKADNRTPDEIVDSLKQDVENNFKMNPETIRKHAMAEAAEKYPLAKKNQEVKVLYRDGRSIYSYTGHFYGYSYGKKGVKLNSKTISLFNMLDDSKAMFDKKLNAEKRTAYADAKVREYMKKRLSYADLLYTRKKKKIQEKNEKLGYILHDSKWVTAEFILNLKLPDMIKQYKERAEKERLAKEAAEKAKQEAGGEKKKSEDEDEDY